MTTHTERLKWATFHTWSKDRRKAKRVSRRVHRELQQLLEQAPAALAAAQNRKTMSDNYWSEEAMEARQEARREAIRRCGPPARREKPARVPSEREQRIAAGLIFSDRDDQLAAIQAADRARRARADEAVTSRERLYNTLRDDMGEDWANDWMRGGE